jgi:hypothetical protein
MRAGSLTSEVRRSVLFVTALCLACMVAPSPSGAQPRCTAAPLTEAQLGAIVAKERQTRQDLPPAPGEYTTAVRKQGCHYVYIEYPVPRTPDRQNIFTINQDGVIVDTQPATMKCPDRQLTESDLLAIVNKARSQRDDLPPPFANPRTRVDRMRCLYLYFEHPVPSNPRDFQVFTIDPLGELMSGYRNHR